MCRIQHITFIDTTSILSIKPVSTWIRPLSSISLFCINLYVSNTTCILICVYQGVFVDTIYFHRIQLVSASVHPLSNISSPSSKSYSILSFTQSHLPLTFNFYQTVFVVFHRIQHVSTCIYPFFTIPPVGPTHLSLSLSLSQILIVSLLPVPTSLASLLYNTIILNYKHSNYNYRYLIMSKRLSFFKFPRKIISQSLTHLN